MRKYHPPEQDFFLLESYNYITAELGEVCQGTLNSQYFTHLVHRTTNENFVGC